MKKKFKYIFFAVLAIFVVTLVGVILYFISIKKNPIPTVDLPFLKDSNFDYRFDFQSDNPDYVLRIGNRKEFNKLVSDLAVFNSKVKPSKIRVKLVKEPVIELGGLGYNIFSSEEDKKLISDSTSFFYPNENTVEFQIYIAPEWLKKPSSTTLESKVENVDLVKKELVSFQFIYLLSNINYEKLLSLSASPNITDYRLEFSKNRIDEWMVKGFSTYPLRITGK